MGLRMLTKLCVLLSGTVSPWPGSSGRERVLICLIISIPSILALIL